MAQSGVFTDMAEKKTEMTVREAGHKGGQRVNELIEEGKQAEGSETRKK